MKVSGFTIIRNGESFDYPYLESIRSLLPLVDELIINIGRGTDSTEKVLEDFIKREGEGKIKTFYSEWPLNDPEKKKEGKILSEQTNLALDRCENDWCFYLQADEILHEEDYPSIKEALGKHEHDREIEGLLFQYTHFYGSYDVIQESRSAYRREVRIIKKSSGARSVGDAQSFRKPDGEKLKVTHCGGHIYHYGWVRTPEAMKEKTFFMDQLYHGDPNKDASENKIPFTGENYRYKRFWGLEPFRKTHPSVMKARIMEKGWHWNLKDSPYTWKMSDLKKVTLDLFERATGVRLFEYRSYRLLKK